MAGSMIGCLPIKPGTDIFNAEHINNELRQFKRFISQTLGPLFPFRVPFENMGIFFEHRAA
ncbi:Uncharacterised protein [Mycobacteroides abscessus subsp. abscessus]|nr:Uncharacterised protein [Mycobacteroides abscessus subsp. abscessus]